jgi:hypothetical protein
VEVRVQRHAGGTRGRRKSDRLIVRMVAESKESAAAR